MSHRKATPEHRAEMAARKARRDAEGRAIVARRIADEKQHERWLAERAKAHRGCEEPFLMPLEDRIHAWPPAEPARPRVRMAIETDALASIPEGAQIFEVSPHGRRDAEGAGDGGYEPRGAGGSAEPWPASHVARERAMKTWTHQTQGQRPDQQDAFHCDSATGLFIVADGMGGTQDGAEAARVAVEALREGPFDDWSRLFWEAWRRLPWGGGTTATVCRIESGVITVAHIGDSMAWLVRRGEARRLTECHRVGRHVLTRCLKGYHGHEPDVTTHQLEPGDRLLLATDGLEDLVQGDLFGLVVMLSDMGERAPGHLALYEAKGLPRDNLTVVGVETGG